MKIYFAGSIRGGRDDKDIYNEIIKNLQKFGNVLTEHVGDSALTEFGEDLPNDDWIFSRDMDWIKEADILISEVTNPSLGVGYEIGRAEKMGKPILCLYRKQAKKRLSAMINGNSKLTIGNYSTIKEAKILIQDFIHLNTN